MIPSWPLTGIRLGCVICKQSLCAEGSDLVCKPCGFRYKQEEGIAIMLAEDEAQGAAHKEAVREVFDSINRSLETKGLSRFSTFINWGYASLEEEQPGFQGVNGSFIRLLHEIIGGADVAGKDIVEIGCGRGGNINELCKSYGAGSAVGIDLTPSNIVFCHRNNRYEQAYYCVGDAERLPIQSECCDSVLNVESSHLYPNIDRFFAEAYRVLKPGGTFIYADIMNAADVPRYEKIWNRLGFRMTMNRDITANVLQSGEASFGNRIQVLGGSFESDEGTMEWLEAPGTQKHEDMKAGRRLFKIMHLVKEIHCSVDGLPLKKGAVLNE